jgi:uncharacterized RDD family membrane protein YckC
VLDTYRTVETPEGVEFGLRVAGPAPRAAAWVVDCAIRGGLYFILATPLSVLGESGVGVFLLVLFLGEWFYPVLFEVLRHGATPGKKRYGLTVLHEDGSPVGWTSSILRNLLRFADFLPLAYGFGLATMMVTRDFQRLGDLAAGTVVVHQEPLPTGSGVPAAEPTPPPAPLGSEEQRVVIEFAERLRTWSESRAGELATLARPLTGSSGADSVSRLVSIANWLLGRR